MRQLLVWAACACALVGCASNLPAFPFTTTIKPAPTLFTGAGRCRVRAEALVFDGDTRWGGQSEAEFVATLRAEARPSHDQDKVGTAEEYFKQLKINERDYLGARGSLTTASAGDEPFVLRSRVMAVDTKSGALDVVHALYTIADGQKVAEVRINQGNVGFGLGSRMRTATIPQAWTMLRYFADRFACNGPARVTD